jgi:hypothetical protein
MAGIMVMAGDDDKENFDDKNIEGNTIVKQ